MKKWLYGTAFGFLALTCAASVGISGCQDVNSCNTAQCTQPSDCATGFCVDSVCCATDCSSTCVACNLPGSLGTCTPVPMGQNEAVCTTACDGYGGCLKTTGNACTAGSQCISHICNDLVCDSPKPANGPLVWLTTLVAKNLVTTTDLRVDQIAARNDGSVFIDGMEIGGFTLNGTKTENFCCFWQILGVEFSAAGASTTVAVDYCSDNFGNSCSRNIIKTQGDVQLFSTYSKSYPDAAPSTRIVKSAPPLYTRQLTEVNGARGDAAGNSVLKGTSSIKDNDSPVDYGDGVKYPYDRLVKYDASGNVTLNTPFPVPEASIYASSFWSFALASNGDIYGSSLQNEMKLAKINAAGVVQWIKSIPVQLGAGEKQSMALQLDSAENMMVAFHFSGNVDLGNGPMVATGTTDLALAKLDSTGNVLWQKHYGSPGFDLHSFTMERTGADDLAIAGEFSGSIDFGKGPLTGTAFIAKFDTNGNELWHIDVQKSLQDGGIAVSGNPTGDVYMSTSSPSFDLGWGPILAGKMGIIVAKYASM